MKGSTFTHNFTYYANQRVAYIFIKRLMATFTLHELTRVNTRQFDTVIDKTVLEKIASSSFLEN